MGTFYQSFGAIVLVGIQAGLLFAWLSSSVTSVGWRLLTLLGCVMFAAGVTVFEIAVLSTIGKR